MAGEADFCECIGKYMPGHPTTPDAIQTSEMAPITVKTVSYTFPMMRQALCPPKPKEFDMAVV